MPVFNESVVIGYGIVGAKIGIFIETSKYFVSFLLLVIVSCLFCPGGHHSIVAFYVCLIGTFS